MPKLFRFIGAEDRRREVSVDFSPRFSRCFYAGKGPVPLNVKRDTSGRQCESEDRILIGQRVAGESSMATSQSRRRYYYSAFVRWLYLLSRRNRERLSPDREESILRKSSRPGTGRVRRRLVNDIYFFFPVLSF